MLKEFYVPPVETRLIESTQVHQTFEIKIMQPLTRRDPGEKFPVLYLTDGNLAFDFVKGIAHCLQSTGQVRRFIVVSIGYPGDNPFAGDLLRCRDLVPEFRRVIPGLPQDSAIEGVSGFGKGEKNWGGASEFLNFVRDDLFEFVDGRYPTIRGDRGYFGHSLGGELGLYVLFSQPDMFSRYVISSPGISYDDDDFGLREARQFIASVKSCNAKVVMSVGDQEEFDPLLEKSQMVSSFYRLANLFHKARIPGFDFSSYVISGETHVSAWPVAFSRGMQLIYGAAEGPPV